MPHNEPLNRAWEAFSEAPIWKVLTYGLLLLGGLLWVTVFVQDRSLFLDEANLARNIVELDYVQFFGPLMYEQFAPPFFMVVEKAMTQLFGNSTYALRLFPLLAGLAALVLLMRIQQILDLPWWLRAFLVWMICFTGIYLRYATEAKQYGVDMFFALLLVERALSTTGNPFRSTVFWRWGLGGMLVIWFSMPSVFVLSGVGLAFLYRAFETRDRRALYPWLWVIGAWLLSFAVYYFCILKQDVDSSYLQNYHHPFFYPLFPVTAEELGQAGHLWSSIFHTYWGYTAMTYVIGIPALFLGLIHLYKADFSRLLLLAFPIIACFIASGLKQYSMILRLCLFFLPLLLLLSGVGIAQLTRLNIGLVRWGSLLLLLLTAGLHDRYRHFVEPFQIEDPRSALEFVEGQWESGDVLYLGKWAVPPYAYYSAHHPVGLSGPMDTLTGPVLRLTEIEAAAPRIWLVYTHLVAPEEDAVVQRDLELLSRQGLLPEKVATFEATTIYKLLPDNKVENE